MTGSAKKVLLIGLFCLLAGTVQAENLLPSLDISRLREAPELLMTEQEAVTVSGKGRGTPSDWTGRIGLALLFYQGNYWTDDTYSARSYTITPLSIQDNQGLFGSLEAYRISPPLLSSNLKFIASGNSIFFKPTSTENHVVYLIVDKQLGGNMAADAIHFKQHALVKLETLDVAKLNKDGLFTLQSLQAHKLKQASDLLIVPQRISLASSEPGTLFATTSLGTSAQFKFPVPGLQSDTALLDAESRGPAGNRYGTLRQTQLQSLPDGRLVWTWQNAQRTINLGTIFPDGKSTNVPLPVSLSMLLATAFTAEHVYYITVGDGNNPTIKLVKTDHKGKLVASRVLSNTKEEFNVFAQGNYPVSLVYGNGTLALILSRTMQKSSDGLNHQGSIAASFNAETLATIKNLGQNSGHSFNNRMIFDGEAFISLDLGDNYPRGVIMHRITPEQKQSRIIYTFKTHHPNKPSPYRQGLGPGQWSNDNETYTEFGDIVDTGSAYAVLLAGEKSWRNETTGKSLNEARNLSFVLVSRNFTTTSRQVDNIVSPAVVISKGEDTPEFHFYTFDGKKSLQKRVGTIWLTNYQNMATENATRPKLVKTPDGNLLALWEVWSADTYRSTRAMLLSPSGEPKSSEIDLSTSLRLSRESTPIVAGNKVLWAMPGTNELRINVLQLTSDDAPAPTPQPIPSPVTAGLSAAAFAGRWETWWDLTKTDGFLLELQANGANVSGRYAYNGGTLTGSLQDNANPRLLSGRWTEQDGGTGWIKLLISTDGKSLEGRWGMDGERGEGLWIAEKR